MLRLVLRCCLATRLPEEEQCRSCTAWTTTYDLSAILGVACQCLPRLAALTFSTHYISEAECTAIGMMTGGGRCSRWRNRGAACQLFVFGGPRAMPLHTLD